MLSKDEFEALVKHLPAHLKPIVTIAYYTGMRKGEILALIWEKVDLKNRIIQLEAADTKNDEPRTIPICAELAAVLKSVPRAIHDDHVFQYRGKPVTDIRKGLKVGCKGAGIKYGRFEKGGFIFHDLRHTFNTNMRKAGVQESVIMAITGHSTREMFDRYNTIDAGDKKDAISQFEVHLQNVAQTVTQATSIGQ